MMDNIFIYTVLLVMRLSLDTSYTFFGIEYSSALAEYGTGRPVFFLEFFYCCSRRNRILLQSSGEKGMIFGLDIRMG